MVRIHRFSALRPREDEAALIASVPYDVVTTREAQEIIEQNPRSFLRVIRSDAELPETDPADDLVYARAKENLDALIERGHLLRDDAPSLSIYRVKEGGTIYTGLVACLETEDYAENRIRRHEHTRYDKEEDRTRHIDTTNANTGLVVLLYRDPGAIFAAIAGMIQHREPDATIKTPKGEVHEIFRIADPDALATLEGLFSPEDSLYIADGHHRAKSAVNVAERRRQAGTLTPEAGRFIGVLFAENRVKIHGYSRLVRDIGSYTPASFLDALSSTFTVTSYGEIDDTGFCVPPLREFDEPTHVIHMYLQGRWYELSCPVRNADDTIGSLDVSILQHGVLEGMLGITDPRADPRVQYLGGNRPLADLEERVDSGEYILAFSIQPVNIETVLAIADEGGVMPPKSTWFEPKLLSGLVLHTLD
ncbi:MAG: DUF1015 family protein [Methanomicrobiaceae archaeon]|nr:DUF1015 family protein [Methanomicrobiaceae archaeon]